MNRRQEAWEAGLAAQKEVESLYVEYGYRTVEAIEAKLKGDAEGEKCAKPDLRWLRRHLEKAVAETLRLSAIERAIEAELDAKAEKRRLAKAAKAAQELAA